MSADAPSPSRPVAARELDPIRHEVWYVSGGDEEPVDDPAILLRAVAATLDDLDSGPDSVDLQALTVENHVGDEGWSATFVVYRRPTQNEHERPVDE